jgi:surface antigen
MRRGWLLVTAMAWLSACASTDRPGGLTADLSRPATPSAILRALDGGLVGRAGLAGLSRADLEKALEAEYRALEYTAAGAPVAWQGGVPPIGGEVVAAQPYRVGSQDCRPYAHSITDASGARTIRGTACRNPDGSWTPLT